MSEANGTRAAFFDVDKTLRKGFLIMDFPTYLAGRGMFDEGKLAEMKEVIRQYHAGTRTYFGVGRVLLKQYSEGLMGQHRSRVMEEAERFIGMTEDAAFPYTGDLVGMMNGYGRTIALSGSPVEVVRLFSERHGIGMTRAAEADTDSLGRYTGEVRQDMVRPEPLVTARKRLDGITQFCDENVDSTGRFGSAVREMAMPHLGSYRSGNPGVMAGVVEPKERVFWEIVAQEGIDPEQAFGFGDSGGDLPFLRHVGHPVALNPNRELAAYCEERGMPMFTDHGEVVEGVRKILESVR
jgi:phosphoserine phosphatase